MKQENSTVAMYTTRTDAEAAVSGLKEAGLDLKKLSIVERRADEFLVVAEGSSEEMARAREIAGRLSVDEFASTRLVDPVILSAPETPKVPDGGRLLS